MLVALVFQDWLDRGPLIGGKVQILPGVTNYTAGAVGGDNTGTLFQVNGMRQNANSFYLDGVFDNAMFRQGGNTVSNPDAIREFRLLTSNFDSEDGCEPGGVVNSITRSGSNQFHGVAYDYLRNTCLMRRIFSRPV